MNKVVKDVEGTSFMWIKPAGPELKQPNVELLGPDPKGKLSLLFEDGVPDPAREDVVGSVKPRLLWMSMTPEGLRYAITLVRTRLAFLVGESRLKRRFYKGWEFRLEDGTWV